MQPPVPARPTRSEIVSVGTELLLGQIVDTNSHYLAGRLARLGIDVLHMSSIGDNLGRASALIREALRRSDLVVMTGGLGPTEDDLTREAIAAAVGEEPTVDPTLEERLRAAFSGRGMRMPARNLKQAWLIPSARALDNPHGTAPGWDVRLGEARLIAMPGVPREMIPMWEELVEPTLVGGRVIRSRTLKLLGIGESAVEERLDELVRSTAPTVATYAKADGVHIRLTDAGPDAEAIDRRIGEMEARVRERLDDHIWGTDGETLGQVIAGSLGARDWTLAVAEARSAGLVTTALAAAAGAAGRLRGLILPGATAAELTAALEQIAPQPELRLTVSIEDLEWLIVLNAPSGERSLRLRSADPDGGARRASLVALDLLRQILA